MRHLACSIEKDGNEYLSPFDLARIRPRHLPIGTTISTGIPNEASGLNVTPDQTNISLQYAPLGNVDGRFYGECHSIGWHLSSREYRSDHCGM